MSNYLFFIMHALSRNIIRLKQEVTAAPQQLMSEMYVYMCVCVCVSE